MKTVCGLLTGVVALAGLAVLGGCETSGVASGEKHGKPSPAAAMFSGSHPIQIVCTTQQVADMLQHIGGRHVAVDGLMGPGVDPHLYKATPSDNKKLKQADLIFFNGMHLEGRLADLMVRMARSKPTFAVTEGLQAAADPRLREPPEFEGHYDPHVWHDASLWADCVEYAARQMEAFDPPNAADYRENAEQYKARLQTLHEASRQQMATIPAERRVLVTAHDAFGYFGQAYDIEVHGLQGVSTVDEPDVAAMEELVELLTSRKIKAVFVESSVPPKNLNALVEACAAKEHQVVIGGELYSDAMGDAGTPEAAYLGMYQHNVKTVAEALR